MEDNNDNTTIASQGATIEDGAIEVFEAKQNEASLNFWLALSVAAIVAAVVLGLIVL